MDKNIDQKEIHTRATNKAHSKIYFLKEDIQRTMQEIANGSDDGRISIELLEKSLNSYKRDLKTWKYILNLIYNNEPESDEYELLNQLQSKYENK
tara:strand:+ start:886 stop:1170 length:285 start_codon:yes stop_codon:yes gene_type:complete